MGTYKILHMKLAKSDVEDITFDVSLKSFIWDILKPWDFFGGNDAEAVTPVIWPPHAKSWLIGKDSDAGTD